MEQLAERLRAQPPLASLLTGGSGGGVWLIRPETWVPSDVLPQLATLDGLWFEIDRKHLPIQGVPDDGWVFGARSVELGVRNLEGNGILWGGDEASRAAEAERRLLKALLLAAPMVCGGGGGRHVGPPDAQFLVRLNPPGLNVRALLGRPHGLRTTPSARQTGSFAALAAIAPGTILEAFAIALQILDQLDGCLFSELGLYITRGSPHRDVLAGLYRGNKDPTEVKAGASILRIPFLLGKSIIAVLTMRVHLDDEIDALGPFVRFLRGGIFCRFRELAVAEALPGAADFCFFRLGANPPAIPTWRDGWRVYATEWDASRIVRRWHRHYFNGVAVVTKLLGGESPFEHGSCGSGREMLPVFEGLVEEDELGEAAAADGVDTLSVAFDDVVRLADADAEEERRLGVLAEEEAESRAIASEVVVAEDMAGPSLTAEMETHSPLGERRIGLVDVSDCRADIVLCAHSQTRLPHPHPRRLSRTRAQQRTSRRKRIGSASCQVQVGRSQPGWRILSTRRAAACTWFVGLMFMLVAFAMMMVLTFVCCVARSVRHVLAGGRWRALASWLAWPRGWHGLVASVASWRAWLGGGRGLLAGVDSWRVWRAWPRGGWLGGGCGLVAGVARGRRGLVAGVAPGQVWTRGGHGFVGAWLRGRRGLVAGVAPRQAWTCGGCGRAWRV